MGDVDVENLTLILLLAAAAAFMPAHAAALNDLSSTPPVSLTMQPVNLAVVAAELPEPAAALDELLVLPADGAELVLLPHAAMTSVADTASAAVAHALCFTLTSPWASTPRRLASHLS